MLTGTELLSKVKELGDVSKSDLVRACGYVTTKKDGQERLKFTAFYEALLEAKGVSVSSGSKSDGRRGRKLSYTTKIQFNGNLMVGKAYTTLLGLQPGDEFEIKLGRKQIKLIPIGTTDEEASDFTECDSAVNAEDEQEGAASPLGDPEDEMGDEEKLEEPEEEEVEEEVEEGEDDE